VKAEADLMWDKVVASNPALKHPSTIIKLNSQSFEKQLRKAFEAGRQVGFSKGHEVGKLAKVTEDEKSMLDNLFNQFGD
jgi:hypothetical protein